MGGRGDQVPAILFPRVKVREQPDPNSLREETNNLLVRVIESLSQEGHGPMNIPVSDTGSDYKNGLPLPNIRISSARPSSVSTPSICNGSEGRNKKGVNVDKKHTRSSSVPRPRAVLSSPDNDDMIGHQNRLSRQRERLLKGQTLRESAAGQCKPTLKNVRAQSPINRRESTGGTNNDYPKTKPSLTHEKPLRQAPRKAKPNPVWI